MFRHSLAGVLMSLALVFAAPVLAQTPTFTPSHLQAARELMQLTGVTQNIDNIYREFEDSAKQLVTTRPEAVNDMKAVVAELKPEADRRADEMTGRAAEVFASKMNEADIKAVIAFFKSPLGETYMNMRTAAMRDIFPLLEPWSVQTSNYLFDRFSQEMRKRGHML